MSRIAVITANLGGFDIPVTHSPQDAEIDWFHFTDENFPPRSCAMTPRLQARIPKMFGWQMAPGYDVYLWVDSSCALARPDSVSYFVDQVSDADVALFKHPHRSSVQEEADYLKGRLAKGCPYITARYKGELLDEQMAEILDDPVFSDNRLFASTVLVYRDNCRVKNMMREWWYHTSRYHSIDQLSLPYAMCVSGVEVKTIDENYLKSPYLKYVRPHGHR